MDELEATFRDVDVKAHEVASRAADLLATGRPLDGDPELAATIREWREARHSWMEDEERRLNFYGLTLGE